VIFVFVLLKWRYVSLGSLVGTALMPAAFLILNQPREYIFLSIIVGIFIFLKHKDNIKRLLDGKENKM
jgi:glycerol-3-phosphate acyltransferase PlsY